MISTGCIVSRYHLLVHSFFKGPYRSVLNDMGPVGPTWARAGSIKYTKPFRKFISYLLVAQSEPQIHINPRKTTPHPPSACGKGWGIILRGFVRIWDSEWATRRYEMNFQNGFAYFVGPAQAHVGPNKSLVNNFLFQEGCR